MNVFIPMILYNKMVKAIHTLTILFINRQKVHYKNDKILKTCSDTQYGLK